VLLRGVALAAVACLRFAPCQANAGTEASGAPGSAAAQTRAAAPVSIELAVDARDVRHRIISVQETIPVAAGTTQIVLLFPKWIPGDHAPDAPIERVAGLTIQAKGVSMGWRRQASDVFSFKVRVPPDADHLDVKFQYLAASADVRSGATITRDIVAVKWPYLLLYPAGYPAAALTVHARARLPDGFSWVSSLTQEPHGADAAATAGAATATAAAAATGAGAGAGEISFVPVSLDTLIDSPLYAGSHMRQFALDAAAAQPIRLTLFSDRGERTAMTSEQLAWHRALVHEADAVFGSRPFAHYDLIVTLAAPFGIDGLEHRQSSEIFLHPDSFTDWQGTWDSRYLLAHEFVHAWNGKWRMPAGLYAADLNTDLNTDLLWVYEGQTQYWAKILSTRSGIWSTQQMYDDLAVVAAQYAHLPARAWRPLLDSTLDPVINPREETEWRSWQRFQDYYDEGSLVWLDVDTLLRSRTQGKRSLDDFAREFFAGGAASPTPKTYELTDVIAALNHILPYDWQKFFEDRIALVGQWNPLEGIRRGGYDLVFNDQPGPACTAETARHGLHCFTSSVGLTVDGDGIIESVEWNGVAFRAGLSAGMKLISVNGVAFSPEALLSAIVAAQTSPESIDIVAEDQDHVDQLHLPYHGGPRYPHLVRTSGTTDWLDASLQPRAVRPK
jgi:predicted metalloprotease with PDZ domain